MVIKIQTSEKSNGNKGSSMAMANYLEKEDLQNENESFDRGELPQPRKGFFNHDNDKLMKGDVIAAIDNNKKGLTRNDSKFYAINIAPSEKEQQHLLKQITGKDNIESISDLSTKDLNVYEAHLKEYSRKVMDEYASHFKRDGLKDGAQLVYFGKIEHQRYYKGTDENVKKGFVKSGEKKPGLNSHIHIIVSRKDNSMRWKLSPLANDKGSKKCITNNRRVQRGFDRNLFNIKSETLFDKQFSYGRKLEEKAEYRIEASKDPLKSTKIKLEQNQRQKEELQRQLINQYDQRNNYSDKDKETQHDVEPSIQKERNNNKEMSL